MEITPLEKISFFVKMLFITIAAGILIAIIVGVLIYNRQPSVKLLNERQKALELEASGDFAGAESVMLAANEKYPGFPVSQETLAGIYLDWGAALLRSGTAEGFTAGLEKFRAALEQEDIPQIRDSAVRVILEVLPAEAAADSAAPAADRTQEFEGKLERLAEAKAVFDDSRLTGREEEVLSAWLTDLLRTNGDRKTVEIMQELLETDPGNAASAAAFVEACRVFAANRRHAVTEGNDPAEIRLEMDQAVDSLHQWAVRLAELSVAAGQESEAGRRLGVQALALEGLAKEYDIERAGLIAKSEERIAERGSSETAGAAGETETAEAAEVAEAVGTVGSAEEAEAAEVPAQDAETTALAVSAEAQLTAFRERYPDHGMTQYAIARGIQEHCGFGWGSSTFQTGSGTNDEHTQTWVTQHHRPDGSMEQLLYVVDLEDQSFRQVQYSIFVNGEERQEERSTGAFSFTPFYNEEAFNSMLAAVSDALRTALPETDAAAQIAEEDLWITFRYFTDGTSADGETKATGVPYYRAGCVYNDEYHEFIVLDGGDGNVSVREVESAG